ALWPDADEANALFYLRRTLTELRRALGSEAVCLLSPTSRTLRLDLSGADCDLAAFDQAMARGDVGSLQDAVALYRGPLLEECLQQWAGAERGAREQAYLRALEPLADHAADGHDAAEAARLLRQVVAADPFRESAICRLMEALAAMGDHAAITQVYRDF